LWQEAVLPLCNEMLSGCNIAAIVYGAEKTGNTYTMFGSSEDDKFLGITNLSVKFLFEQLQNLKIQKKCQYELTYSILEINGDKIYDVLNEHEEVIQTKDDIKDEKDIKDYEEINIIKDSEELNIVENLEEFNKFINKATTKKFGFPSHIILRLTLIMTYHDGSRHVSIANFVDLGPMNGISDHYYNEPLAKFEGMISIVSAGEVHDKNLFPSVLTKLLHQCIAGNCKTVFILTAAPHPKQLKLTKKCFEFGQKIKNIKNHPKANCEIPTEILRKNLKKITQENKRLQEEYQTQSQNFINKINQLENEIMNLQNCKNYDVKNMTSSEEHKKNDANEHELTIENKNKELNDLQQIIENQRNEYEAKIENKNEELNNLQQLLNQQKIEHISIIEDKDKQLNSLQQIIDNNKASYDEIIKKNQMN